MVAFLTVFLSLVAGPQSVALSVGDQVATVELLLDGRRVARLDGAPWTAAVDLGAALAPHRLSAVAFDGAGQELARAEQWINLPRPRSQVQLLPESTDGQPPRAVRVLWQSVDGVRPALASYTFDGVALEIDDLERIVLPAYDPDRVHLLRAELLFGRSLAHAEIVIGGHAGETVGTELTAYPAQLATAREPPPAGEMSGWFARGERPLRVMAVDRGAADLIVVQDQTPRILGQLDRLRRDLAVGSEADLLLKPGPTGIRQGDRLRVLVPYGLPLARPAPAAAGGATPRELFPISGDLAIPIKAPTTVGVGQRLVAGPRPSGLLAAAFYRAPPAGVPQRLADAVAEAGRAAAAGGRPRVVILITGPRSTDASRFSPAAVRDYLRRLRVPLVVWSPEAPQGWSVWGESAVRIRNRAQLLRAVRDLRRLLNRQLVVWLEGRHLPQEIGLTAAAAPTLEPLAP